MKAKLNLITLLLFICNITYAQINELFGVAKELKMAHSKKQKEKLANEYLQYFEFTGKKIPFLRIPTDQIKGDAKNQIISLQNDLDNAKKLCLSGKITTLKFSTVSTEIDNIARIDPDWVIIHYKKELDFYNDYDKEMKEKKEKQRLNDKNKEDSIRRLQDKQKDSIKVVEYREQERKQDSLEYKNRVKGWHFVNAKSLKLYSNASEKSKVIGDISALSYVKIVSEANTKGFVKISVSDYEGYVYKKYLVDDLDKITVPNEDVSFAKKTYTSTITIKPTPQKRQQAVQENRVGNGMYHRGSRGGCYYYSPSGRKVYVDRSLCN